MSSVIEPPTIYSISRYQGDVLMKISNSRGEAALMRTGMATALFASIWLFMQPAFAENRVALVIGNGTYHKVPTLPNPTRDAADMSKALERLNFKVTQLSNATAAEMRKAIVDFGRSTEGAEMAVVFYAGTAWK